MLNCVASQAEKEDSVVTTDLRGTLTVSRVTEIVVVLLLMGLASINPVDAATYMVTNTNNIGTGSLRWAIDQANGNAGTDSIHFNIPGAGPHTIQPVSALSTITEPMVIDGTTEPDFGGTPIVELDGTNAGAGVLGLLISAGGSTVRGLVINRFDGHGIRMVSNGSNVIASNYIGIDVTGTSDLGNANNGINIDGADSNTIGGTTEGERNVISGNNWTGIWITNASYNVVVGNYIGTDITGAVPMGNWAGIQMTAGSSYNRIGGTQLGSGNLISGNPEEGIRIGSSGTYGNIIQGNFVGTDASGNAALGNDSDGIVIYLDSIDNLIGGDEEGAANRIAFNGGSGVLLNSTSATHSNRISCNSILSNAEIGIDLSVEPNPPYRDGVTPNDPGDFDTGPNNLQNYPVLTSATSSGRGTTIEGALNSTANHTFRIEFFSSGAADPSSYGEGEIFLGASTEVTDGSGNVSFSVLLPPSVPGGYFVSSTATDSDNNTSEFSEVVSVFALVLSGEVVAGDLVLEWNTVPSAANYWVHGVDNQAYFAPDLGNRLAIVPSGTTTWSSSNGIGDPDHNWTYLVSAVDGSNLELIRSNRVGECDYDADIS
jgi:parallel beta-helix repeat protein